MQFVGVTKAYFIDAASLQVVTWNPQDMTVSGSFPIDGLAEEGLIVRGNYAHRVGDNIILSVRYFREDGSAEQLGRIAVIDTTTDTVTYDDETTCGNLAFSVTNTAGDIYLSSHTAQAVSFEAGIAGEPASRPCVVRVLAGETQFDDTYLLDLYDLTGRPAGAITQGAGDTAYVLVRREDAFAITPENYTSANGAADWEYHSFELGNEMTTYAKVEGVAPTAAYGIAFTTPIGVARTPTPHISAIGDRFAESTFFDITNPGGFGAVLKVPGFGLGAYRLR